MQNLQMLSVTKGYNKPLAGSGKNTIRKYDGKYQTLSVGDNVIVFHTEDPQTHGPALATEFLKVSSMVIAPLSALVKAHGKQNHGYTGAGTVAKLEEHIYSHYPIPEGELRNTDDLYLAIYF